jgi:hypothetical protein
LIAGAGGVDGKDEVDSEREKLEREVSRSSENADSLDGFLSIVRVRRGAARGY